jgi:hypothetical protein
MMVDASKTIVGRKFSVDVRIGQAGIARRLPHFCNGLRQFGWSGLRVQDAAHQAADGRSISDIRQGGGRFRVHVDGDADGFGHAPISSRRDFG